MTCNKDQDDTIAGISTAAGGGIGVIRVSGAEALACAAKVFVPAKPLGKSGFKSHKVYYGRIQDPITGAAIDEALLIVMLAPKSYTREDVAEFHCHGGQESLRRTLAAVTAAGARPAEPGEFTKRAFLNGRIDLAQAEAVMELLGASGDRARTAAVSQLEGKLSARINDAYASLLNEISMIEATLDSPEHALGLGPAGLYGGMKARLTAIKDDLTALANTNKLGRLIKDGAGVLIAGPPNVGKSSLLNALLGQDRAIVTDIPGTTRDLLTEHMTLGSLGLAMRLTDTAGIRAEDKLGTLDPVERIGVERAKQAFDTADLILFVLDGSKTITQDARTLLTEITDTGKPMLCLINKSDLPQNPDSQDIYGLLSQTSPTPPIIHISAKTGHGLDKLAAAIEESLLAQGPMDDAGVVVTLERHKDMLTKATEAITRAITTINQGLPEDFVTIDLTEACNHLTAITGQNATEDLINAIFSTFCIGK